MVGQILIGKNLVDLLKVSKVDLSTTSKHQFATINLRVNYKLTL